MNCGKHQQIQEKLLQSVAKSLNGFKIYPTKYNGNKILITNSCRVLLGGIKCFVVQKYGVISNLSLFFFFFFGFVKTLNLFYFIIK